MAQAMNKFTRKQAGVIYRQVKLGNIEMDKKAVSRMYNDVNDGGIDWNGATNREIQFLHLAVDAIFADDMAKAQSNINYFIAA